MIHVHAGPVRSSKNAVQLTNLIAFNYLDQPALQISLLNELALSSVTTDLFKFLVCKGSFLFCLIKISISPPMRKLSNFSSLKTNVGHRLPH